MSSAKLEDILRDIETLSEEENLVIDQRLAVPLREQWECEVSAARDEANRRGIDQGAIDNTIERLRYGQ